MRLRVVRMALVIATVWAVGQVVGVAGASTLDAKKVTCKGLLSPAKIAKVVGAPVKLTSTGGSSSTNVFCHWTNDAGDDVGVSAYISRRDEQFAFSRDTPTGGVANESVSGVGKEAFFQVLPSGDVPAIWVLAPKASFSLSNQNGTKDPATIRAELAALGKQVAKRLQ